MGLHQSYGKNSSAYIREIREYVRPWGHRLSGITCPVIIHHGTADNWAPVSMAYAMREKIQHNVELIEYEGLGHFSTLRKVLAGSINS